MIGKHWSKHLFNVYNKLMKMGLIWLLIYTFIQWKDWPWSWSSNSLATWCEDPTHWKRPWCWERLRAGGEGDDRGWDGWMASPTRWTWVWASSRSWWWTGKPGMLQSMGSQAVGHYWVTELNCVFQHSPWVYVLSQNVPHYYTTTHLFLCNHYERKMLLFSGTTLSLTTYIQNLPHNKLYIYNQWLNYL